jgi:hypothetical protein
METNTIKEGKAFTVNTRCCDVVHVNEISWQELREATVGQSFDAGPPSSGRGVEQEVLKIVYKDNQGVAGVFSVWGTTNYPKPKDWKHDDKLLWFEFS